MTVDVYAAEAAFRRASKPDPEVTYETAAGKQASAIVAGVEWSRTILADPGEAPAAFGMRVQRLARRLSARTVALRMPAQEVIG